jgi:hypothetical protein
MKIEDIIEAWEKDNQFDTTNLTRESADIPKLHNKYFRIYMGEGMKLRTAKEKFKILKRDRMEWLLGKLSKEDIDEYGWEPGPDRTISTKTEAREQVEQDEIIVNETLRIAAMEMKVEYLESIIKMINNRGFQIKAMVDWERFRTGSL